MRIVIQGGRVIDLGHLDAIADLVIEDDKITEIIRRSDKELPAAEASRQIPNVRIIDACEKIVCPGFIDMHVHLREPGHEYKETIETGCRAAVWGDSRRFAPCQICIRSTIMPEFLPLL
jgi:dihydroorotase